MGLLDLRGPEKGQQQQKQHNHCHRHRHQPALTENSFQEQEHRNHQNDQEHDYDDLLSSTSFPHSFSRKDRDVRANTDDTNIDANNAGVSANSVDTRSILMSGNHIENNFSVVGSRNDKGGNNSSHRHARGGSQPSDNSNGNIATYASPLNEVGSRRRVFDVFESAASTSSTNNNKKKLRGHSNKDINGSINNICSMDGWNENLNLAKDAAPNNSFSLSSSASSPSSSSPVVSVTTTVSPATQTLNHLSQSMPSSQELRYDMSQLAADVAAAERQKQQQQARAKKDEAAGAPALLTINNDKGEDADGSDDDRNNNNCDTNKSNNMNTKKGNGASFVDKLTSTKKVVANQKSVEKVDPSTGQTLRIYPSITQAAMDHGLSRWMLRKVILGQNQQVGGFLWRFHTNTSSITTNEKLAPRPPCKEDVHDSGGGDEKKQHNDCNKGSVREHSPKTTMMLLPTMTTTGAVVAREGQDHRQKHKDVTDKVEENRGQSICLGGGDETATTTTDVTVGIPTPSNRKNLAVATEDDYSYHQGQENNKDFCVSSSPHPSTNASSTSSLPLFEILRITIDDKGSLGMEIVSTDFPLDLKQQLRLHQGGDDGGDVNNGNGKMKANRSVGDDDDSVLDYSNRCCRVGKVTPGGLAKQGGFSVGDWFLLPEIKEDQLSVTTTKTDQKARNAVDSEWQWERQKDQQQELQRFRSAPFDHIQAVAKEGKRPITFVVARRRQQLQVEKNSYSQLQRKKPMAVKAPSVGDGGTHCGKQKNPKEGVQRDTTIKTNGNSIDAGSSGDDDDVLLPFCLLCNGQSHTANNANRRKVQHHPWCPKNMHFDNSGADKILERLKQGVRLQCPVCQQEYKTGRRLHQGQEAERYHSKKCQQNQKRLSRKARAERDSSASSSSSPLYKKKSVLKQKEKKQGSQPQQNTRRSVAKESQRSSPVAPPHEEESLIPDTTLLNGGRLSRQSQKPSSCRQQSTNSNPNDAAQAQPSVDEETMVEFIDLDRVGDTFNEEVRVTWEPCEYKDAGELGGYVHEDIALYSMSGDGVPAADGHRFSNPFFPGTKGEYDITHHTPEEGFEVLKLYRDPMVCLPWGCSFHQHQPGGACLVKNVQPLSPADTARYLGDTGGCGLRVNDMLISVNGEEVTGMTLKEVDFRLETPSSNGPQDSAILIVSRYKFPNKVQQRLQKAEKQYLNAIDDAMNDCQQQHLDWIDLTLVAHHSKR